MTRNAFRRKCKAEKGTVYKLLTVGGSVATVGALLLFVTAILIEKDFVGEEIWIWIFLMGLLLTFAGAIIDLCGEVLISKRFFAYKRRKAAEHPKPQKKCTLENQNGRTDKFREADIQRFLEEMFKDPDQFVTLTAPKPIENVRFVQACVQNGFADVQLGIGEIDTSLVQKLCSADECHRIFTEFYRGEFKPRLYEYTSVNF